MKTLEINLLAVKHLIEIELRLVSVPLNESFKNLGVTDQQLENLRGALNKTFGKSIKPMLSDTIYTYTDRLQGKSLIPTPERVIESAKQDPLI